MYFGAIRRLGRIKGKGKRNIEGLLDESESRRGFKHQPPRTCSKMYLLHST